MARSRTNFGFAVVAVCAIGVLALVTVGGCGGGGGGGGGTTGVVTTNLSDPPTCRAPAGAFANVWVTITKVRAHLSASAQENDAGWVTLVDLTSNPLQVDLLNMTSTACVLATLGSTSGLPVGTYQQIRIYLLANNPGGAATPSPNHCAGTGGFNCVNLASGGLDILVLSSQANTGIKIPPGQIAGGGITLTAGQSADINIDFDACRSIVQEGNGTFRLKPTLHAGEVSVTNASIAGRITDSVTGAAITGGTTMVLVEQADAGGVDRVVAQTLANAADGTFFICPLPAGNYDIVASSIGAGGNAYASTVLFSVPTGTNAGDIPIVAVTGAVLTAGQLTGTVTTTDPSMMATSADVLMTALQFATPAGGAPRLVTVPSFAGSTTAIATASGGTCLPGTDCATWTLVVPPLNPSFGTFVSGSATVFTIPLVGTALYTVDAKAFVPDGSGTSDCSPSDLMTALDIAAMALVVVPGGTTTAATLAFTGCTAGF